MRIQRDDCKEKRWIYKSILLYLFEQHVWFYLEKKEERKEEKKKKKKKKKKAKESKRRRRKKERKKKRKERKERRGKKKGGNVIATLPPMFATRRTAHDKLPCMYVYAVYPLPPGKCCFPNVYSADVLVMLFRCVLAFRHSP